ncbi:uromodulin-like [Eleutherodactylus coqui]|uniref:uromodulin-like n=1 Tax=Eleutherodactylus coqui TaxID=57060 RepID=UPI00346245F3
MNLQCLIILLLCDWSFFTTTMSQTIVNKDCESTTESSSLTYVVDVSASMGDDLAELKKVNDWLLDRVSERFTCGVRKYTMVQFNDPDVGPTNYTNSRSEFGNFFQSLHAFGGDDCPELALAGINLALDISPSNSLIMVLTDASAKDYNDQTLIDGIKSKINLTSSQVFFLVTGLCGDSNDPQFLIYRDIAYWSFGHVFLIDLSDMSKVFHYLDYTLSRPVNTSTRLFSAEYSGGNNTGMFNVSDKFSKILIMTDGLITSISVIGPGDVSVPMETIVSEPWGSVHVIKNPDTGTWEIIIIGEGPHSVTVEEVTATNISATTDCSKCHPNATCEEFSGRKECNCNDGLIGDGFKCSDIDECAYSWSNNCSGLCINTYGSYRCECAYGFIESPSKICVDIDECSDEKLNSCHSLAYCTNYPGGYSCACPYGYYGDGNHCEVNECIRGDCGRDKDCTKSKGSFKCFDPCFNYVIRNDPWRSINSSSTYYCDSDLFGWYRFIGTGGIRMSETCMPERQCATQFPIWVNGIHPVEKEGIANLTACINYIGSCCYWSTSVQIKACPDGYHVYKINGVPFCNSAYCTDPGTLKDVCHCTEDEECRMIRGEYTCACKNGHEVKNIRDLKLDLQCGAGKIKASFRTCQLRSLYLNVTSIYLLNKSCIGYTEGNNTGVISAITPLQQGTCGNRRTDNGTHATYKNTMLVQMKTDGTVARSSRVQLDFSCTYPLDLVLSLDKTLKPVISSVTLTIEGAGEFKAEMLLYKDDTYESPYDGSEISMSTEDTLYVAVTLDGETSDQYVVVLENCFATPTRNPDDPMKYHIIKNRCPNRRDVSVNVEENGVSQRGLFSVQMFKFVGDNDAVYLHCQSNICDTTINICKPSCLGFRSSSPENDENAFALNVGPISRKY